MEQGSLCEHHLEAAVWKELSHKKEKHIVGPGIGNDYSEADGIIVADGYGESPAEAFTKARGNFLCSLGSCKLMRVQLCLSEHTKQSKIKAYMQEFRALAEQNNYFLLGGQSQVSKAFSEDSFFVELVGRQADFFPERRSVKVGDDIVMIGVAGAMGTNRLLHRKGEDLGETFSPAFLSKAEIPLNNISEVERLLQQIQREDITNIRYIHDISEGGVYRALWQLGEWSHKGLEVLNKRIPIFQETIELCEVYGRNPYLLDGSGAFLLIAEEGKSIRRIFQEKGLECEIIGAITEGKDRIIHFGEGEHRTLTSDTAEEIYKVL